MKNITINDGQRIESLNLDFNKKIIDVLNMLELNNSGTYKSQVNDEIIDISKTFKQNNIENNDVLCRGEENEN